MNNNCQHTDAEYRALQKQVDEARQGVNIATRVLCRAIKELEEFIQERAA